MEVISIRNVDTHLLKQGKHVSESLDFQHFPGVNAPVPMLNQTLSNTCGHGAKNSGKFPHPGGNKKTESQISLVFSIKILSLQL